MKRYIIILFKLLFCIESLLVPGIVEYNGQNYSAGMGTSVWVIDFALNGINEENDGFLEQNVINESKFFFIESLTDNFNIEDRIIKNGYK